MLDFTCPLEFLDFAHRLADASGAIVRKYFRHSFEVEGKADQSPVTEADREVEAALRQMIETDYPHHGIYGEEFGVKNDAAEYVWVLDPIDGTKAFVCGKPLFGTLIALLHKGRPVLGVIDQPILKERWIGGKGHATMFYDSLCATRDCESLSQAVVNLAPQAYMEKFAQDLPAYRKLERAAKSTSVGGDCYIYGLLASGFVDVVIEHALKLYDFAALVPVIEGAGGIITDWQGQPLTNESKGYVLAAGDKRVWEEAVKTLALP